MFVVVAERSSEPFAVLLHVVRVSHERVVA